MISIATKEDIDNLQRQINELRGVKPAWRIVRRKRSIRTGGMPEKTLNRMVSGKVYRVSTLSERLNKGGSAVSMALRSLVKRGLVEKVTHGKYRRK